MPLAILVFSLAVFAAGCGGGNDEGVTKASFTSQAGQICKEGIGRQTAALKAAFEDREKSGKPTANAVFLKQTMVETGIPPLARMVDELSALDLPEEGHQEAASMVASFAKAISRMEQAPLDALNGGTLFAEAKEQAAALGIKACGQVY